MLSRDHMKGEMAYFLMRYARFECDLLVLLVRTSSHHRLCRSCNGAVQFIMSLDSSGLTMKPDEDYHHLVTQATAQ